MAIIDLTKVWPEWKVEKQIGKGSFGVVYQAVRSDNNVTSYSAIKVISIPADEAEISSLRSEGIDESASRTYYKGVVDDFVSEIRLMESFKGIQNIVSVEDYKVIEKTDTIGWDIYIRMELLRPITEILAETELAEKDVIKLGVDICTALEICGKRDIIHRDVKPENIFVNGFGFYKLGDFGIARKLSGASGGLSHKGTPNYIAPEVSTGAAYDGRVDVYSLGIVLYRLLNGNLLPFLSEGNKLNPNERQRALERRLSGEKLPAPLKASKQVASVILKACEYDPNKRFANASEMKAALQKAAEGKYVIEADKDDKTLAVNKDSKKMKGETATPVKKKSKKPLVVVLCLLLALMIGIGVLVVILLSDNKDGKDRKDSVVSAEISSNDNSSEAESEDVETVTSNADTSETVSEEDEESIESTVEESEDVLGLVVSEADALAENGDYDGAIKKIEAALEEYPDDETLLGKIDEYNTAKANAAKQAILDEAAGYAEEEDYSSALQLVSAYLVEQPDDADYKAAYDEYLDKFVDWTVIEVNAVIEENDYTSAISYYEKVCTFINEDIQVPAATNEKIEALATHIADSEKAYNVSVAIEEANTLIGEDKYIEAYAVLTAAIEANGEEEALVSAVEQCETDYVQYVKDTVEQYIANDEPSKAKKLVGDATEAFPENEELSALFVQVNENDSVGLNTLTPINGGFEWNSGDPADPFGNDYLGVSNYTIMHASTNYNGDHHWESTYSAEYMVSQEYDFLSFTVSPYSDFGQSASSYIRIYADNVVRYTSDKVGQRTQPYNIKVDISDAEYIKIVVKVGGYGCIMLSDVKLTSTSGYESPLPQSYTALNTLSFFNGSLPWQEGYPQDTLGGDYKNARNYSVLHAESNYNGDHHWESTFSAEYYINKKYEHIIFDISPYTDIGSSATSVVKIYADDTLIYTSADIDKKTAKFSTGEIDLTDVVYLKIVVEVGGYGCCMISDAVLKDAN